MRFAICQELFEGWTWERQCRVIRETGYAGIELAPFTLAPRIEEVSAARRQELRRIAEAEGLQIIGLHWLLAKTTGFHLTTRDASVRSVTAQYLCALAEACADLGGDMLVLGSPLQRSLEPGVNREEGMDHAAEVLRAVAPTLAACGVTLALEPLTPRETNFLNTCAEAVALMRLVDSPRVRLHQDVKAMISESEPIPVLIEQFAAETAHFHVNDENLLGPGMGPTDYAPIFAALQRVGYAGWVSVEVFDYSPGAEFIAQQSLAYMRETLARLS